MYMKTIDDLKLAEGFMYMKTLVTTWNSLRDLCICRIRLKKSLSVSSLYLLKTLQSFEEFAILTLKNSQIFKKILFWLRMEKILSNVFKTFRNFVCSRLNTSHDPGADTGFKWGGGARFFRNKKSRRMRKFFWLKNSKRVKIND